MNPVARALLTGLVDYAGLFPPAGLGMPETVRNFADYQARPDSWALGRLVVPVSRLAEFEQAIQGLRPQAGWPLSVLIGGDLSADRNAILDFNRRHPQSTRIESLEVKVASIDQVEAVRRTLDLGLEVYCETALGPELEPLIPAIKQAGLRAKVRTGGIKAADIPAPEAVVRFLAACAGQRLPFKATAGLHHPVRGIAPLTYEPDAPCATMFGYLNMIVAAAALWSGRPEREALSALTQDRNSIAIGAESLKWGSASYTADELAATRQRFMLSIGSCSFTEPMEEIAPLISLDSAEARKA